MNFLSQHSEQLQNDIKDNGPLLLTICSGIGIVLTAVLAAKAKPKADILIEKRHAELDKEETKVEQICKDILVTAPVYAPAVISGTLSIGAEIASYKISSERVAAFATAYTLTEAKLADYQKKVIDTIGEKKEKKLRDEIAEEKVRKAEYPEDLDLADETNQICYDLVCKRYFKSNIETIRQAVVTLNEHLNDDMFVSWNDFRYLIGLPEIGYIGDDNGWNADNGKIQVHFSSVLNGKNEPCLAIDYEVEPRYDLRRLM